MRARESQPGATADRLLTVMQSLGEAVSRLEVLDIVLDGAMSLATAEAGAIALLDGDELAIVVERGPVQELLSRESRLSPDAEGLLAETARTGRPVVVGASQDGRHGRVARTQPLVGKDGPLGVLAIALPKGRRVKRGDGVLLAALAESCVQALERLHVLDLAESARAEAEAAKRRQRFLDGATETLSSSLDYRLTLRRLAQLLVPALADWCSVSIVEADELKTVALAPANPDKLEGALELETRFPSDPTGERGLATVIRTGQTEVYERITDDILEAGTRNEEHLQLPPEVGLTAAIIVPLTARGRTFGAITLVSAESGRTYDADDVALAEELARRAGMAVDNARLFGDERQARREVEQLQALTAMLAEALTTEEVASVIVEEAVGAVGAAAGAVLLLSPDGEELEMVGSAGYATEVFADFSRFSVHAPLPAAACVREGEAIWLDRIAAVPLNVGDRVLGAIALSFGSDRAITEMERGFILTLAHQCAQAFERARLFEGEQAARAAAERAQEWLQHIQEILEIGLSHDSLDELLEDLLARVREVMATDNATILLFDESGSELRARSSVGPDRSAFEDVAVPVGQGLVGRLVTTGKPLVVEDVASSPIAMPHLKRAAQSFVGVPLFTKEGVIGVLQLTTKRARRFREDEVELLEAVAARAALAIERTSLYEHEHQIAETLQRSMLPQAMPRIAGLEIEARYVPGSAGVAVGGDWYDALELPDGRIGIAVGDIVGKGLRAATEMMQLRNAFRAYALERLEPAELLERMNGLVERQGGGQFSTLVYAIYDPRQGSVSFACAGHPPPLVRDAEGAVTFLEGGRSLPLGVAPEARCEQAEADVPTGATLLLYTDGLFERRDSGVGEDLSRLAHYVQEGPAELGPLVDALVSETGLDAARDDIALVALRPIATPSHLSLGLPAAPESLRRLRHELRTWLEQIGVGREEIDNITLACNEACTNAIEHPLAPRTQLVQVEADVVDGRLAIVVRDSGRWRTPDPHAERGFGLRMIQDLMDGFEVNRSSDGTEVRMSLGIRKVRSL
jgi:serine phosphatase RsbU (regulator of sigma subunit)/anti-sigma regulatory factor (Ser/Thr protein kinase)